MRALWISLLWVNRPDSLFAFLNVLNQATLTHLVWRQYVALANGFSFLELDTDSVPITSSDLRK
jgi:hypothetical protein